jgi:exodeoxyribonuclease VII large subunit
MAVLERGYSILTTMEGAVIRRSADAGAGELLRARLREGELGLRVESTDPKRSG